MCFCLQLGVTELQSSTPDRNYRERTTILAIVCLSLNSLPAVKNHPDPSDEFSTDYGRE